MKKIIPYLIVSLAAGSILFSACTPSSGLEGGASSDNGDIHGSGGQSGGNGGNNGGGDNTEGGDSGSMGGNGGGGSNDGGSEGNPLGGEQGGNQGGAGPGGDSGSINPSGAENAIVEEFYLPTLTVIVSNNGSGYTTGLSAESIGKAEYQLTAPRKMEVDNEQVVELILVPDTLSLEKDKLFQEFEADLIQAFQGQIDLYPVMTAEIVTGTAFSVSPYITAVKPINEDKSTTWLWYMTALQTGTQRLAVIVSTPALVGEVVQNYELVNLEFEIEVYAQMAVAANPTSTFLPAPPTEAPSEPIETVLPANAVQPASSDSAMESAASGGAPDLASSPESSQANKNRQISAELIGLITAIITLIVTATPIYNKLMKRKKAGTKKADNKS